MTVAAIYARKSTAQVADAEATSISRQIESARVFAAARGWTIDNRHVYSDAATSGAETRKLVQRQRLLEVIALDPPPFQVLILRDASRFSRRDGDEAFGELKRIAKSGVDIWFYQDGTQFEFGTMGANVMGFVRAEMNAEYRRQIARWTRDAMLRKAKAGHVTGGRVFGYDNIKVDEHVERRINEKEAAVVRRIFSLSASGTGYTRIAKQLNAERALAPRPQQSRPSGWSPSTVYEVLHRPLYRGEVIWNRSRKRDAEGKTAVAPRPEAEWLRFARPELRIVPEKQWAAVHARLRSVRAQLEIPAGRRRAIRRDIDSKYFLSGFARCANCGGSLSVLSRSHGRRRVHLYGCLAHDKRGATVCDNALVLPVERVDAAVIAELGTSLRPKVVTAILDSVFEAIQDSTAPTKINALKRDLAHLDRKIKNLTDAVESGAAVAPLVKKLQERQAEREALLATVAAAEGALRSIPSRQAVERKVRDTVRVWREKLATDGRQVLREVLAGPIRFTPTGKQYAFEAGLTTGEWIAGLLGTPMNNLASR